MDIFDHILSSRITMFLSNDTERINKFKQYCDSNYSTKDSKTYFRMFLSNLIELDIETNLIKQLGVDKVYKAKGDYSSNIVFLLHEYDEDIIKFLNLFVNVVFKKDIEYFCIWFYKKTDIAIISNDAQCIAIYNEMLKREIKVFNYDLIINLSKLNFNNDKSISFNYDDIKSLSILAFKNDLTNEELMERNYLTNNFFSLVKNTNVKRG